MQPATAAASPYPLVPQQGYPPATTQPYTPAMPEGTPGATAPPVEQYDYSATIDPALRAAAVPQAGMASAYSAAHLARLAREYICTFTLSPKDHSTT